MEPILVAHNLSKSYGKLTAVGNVSLHIHPGECLALLGPNGAGKTTTVEMLEGLITPDSGSIQIFGQDLSTNYRKVMQKVGVLLQDTKLYKKLTVSETLALFASFFDRALGVEEIIRILGLEDKAHSRLEELSGGQQQRAYLGCALINDPALVFLDEPTTGLDPQARRMIWELVAKLKRDQRAFLLTTHYMEEAAQLADRVMVIDHGRIIASGSPAQLIAEHCGGEVLRFSLSTATALAWDSLQNRCAWLRGVKMLAGFIEVAVERPSQQLQELCVAVEALGLGLEALEMRRATLEDVFLKLTGRSMRDA